VTKDEFAASVGMTLIALDEVLEWIKDEYSYQSTAKHMRHLGTPLSPQTYAAIKRWAASQRPKKTA